jgi:hypothetical protein
MNLKEGQKVQQDFGSPIMLIVGFELDLIEIVVTE